MSNDVSWIKGEHDRLTEKTNITQKRLYNVVSILSLAVGVVGLVVAHQGGGGSLLLVVFAIVVVDSVLLLAWGVYAWYWKRTLDTENDYRAALHESREASLIDSMKAERNRMDSQIKAMQGTIDSARSSIRGNFSDFNYATSVLSKGLARHYSVTDSYYQQVEEILESMQGFKAILPTGLAPEDAQALESHIESEAEEGYRRLRAVGERDFIRAHNDFICAIVNRVKLMIESYLESMGAPLKVSVALKLFDAPDSRQALVKRVMEANVYTAFRDSETWEQKKRIEIPMRRYSVAGNSDFSQCLTNGSYYVFNNKTDTEADFLIQSNNFGKFYNSGATVVVAEELADRDPTAKVYGFLACDVNNLAYPDKAVLDDTVAYILMAFSKLIAIYYDNLDAVWGYVYDLLENTGSSYETFWDAYLSYLDSGIRDMESR